MTEALFQSCQLSFFDENLNLIFHRVYVQLRLAFDEGQLVTHLLSYRLITGLTKVGNILGDVCQFAVIIIHSYIGIDRYLCKSYQALG